MMRVLSGIAAAAITIAMASAAQAKPEFLDTLLATYPQYSGALAPRACSNCHVSDADTTLNPFGKQVSDQMKAAGSTKLTADILQKIESLDADGDGASNIAELKAGTAPGDPKSVPAGAAPGQPPPAAPSHPSVGAAPVAHPAAAPAARVAPAPVAAHSASHPTAQPGRKAAVPTAHPAGITAAAVPAVRPSSPGASSPNATSPSATSPSGAAPAPTTAAPSATAATAPAPAPAAALPVAAPVAAAPSPIAATPAPPEEPPWWSPKNAWHPAIVHFPIALFLAGLLLDLVGYLKKNRTLLFAGWYNLVLAAATSVLAILTGFWATINLKLPLSSATGTFGMSLIGTHILLAMLSTIIMWVMVSLRVHRHEEMQTANRILYYTLAFACFVLISYAGHLGGEYVYGS
jgi:uncharacterized membrane protein